MACDAISHAVSKCPFLHNLTITHGDKYARQIACNPFRPADGTRRPLLEEAEDFRTTFALFHGEQGIVPIGSEGRAGSFFDAAKPSVTVIKADDPKPTMARRAAPLPLASMSMNFFDGAAFGDFLKGLKKKKPQHSKGPDRAPKPRKPNPNTRATSTASSSITTGPQPNPTAAGGACPLRKMLGPMAGLVFNSYGKLQCPTPIIKMRAALAATQPVRELRPQALPIKLLAVGSVSAAVNVPCGAWREHFEKFSPGWFVAVHASIPFIAMLRKAVIMPKFAILFTLATAIAGQQMGNKMEKRRLQRLAAAEAGQQAPAAAAAAVAAAPKEVPARVQAQHSSSMPPPFAVISAAGQRQQRVWSRRRQALAVPTEQDASSTPLPCHLEFKQATVADWMVPCTVR